MLVKFTRGTALGGVGNDAHPGDVRELPEAQAMRFVADGRAIVADQQDAARIATPDAPRQPTRKKAS